MSDSVARVLDLVRAAYDANDDTEYDVGNQVLVRAMLRFGTPVARGAGFLVQYRGHQIEVVPTEVKKQKQRSKKQPPTPERPPQYTLFVDRRASFVFRAGIDNTLRNVKRELDSETSPSTRKAPR